MKRMYLLSDVIARDVVEEMRADNAKVAIDRRGRPTKERSAVSRVLWHIWMSVM